MSEALQDKLSKEGGAAGFDDLKKTAKTMGVDLTPAMLKGAPGIKQHRDGDYILEAIVGNPNLSKFMFMFKDTSSIFGGMRLQGKLLVAKSKAAATREFKREFPKAKIISVKEVGDLYGYEETELEEAFTRKDFQKLETTNDHTEAAKKLINMFGTDQEKKTMADIERRHEKTGYISGTDYKMRQIMVNKYYSRLK